MFKILVFLLYFLPGEYAAQRTVQLPTGIQPPDHWKNDRLVFHVVERQYRCKWLHCEVHPAG